MNTLALFIILNVLYAIVYLVDQDGGKRIQIIRLIMEIIMSIMYTIYLLPIIIDICSTENAGTVTKTLYFIILTGLGGFLIIFYGIRAIETFNSIKAIDRKVIKFPKKYNKKK